MEEASLLSRSELARRLRWYRVPSAGSGRRSGSPVPDTGRVSRVLGLSATKGQATVSYLVAVELCEQLGLDPVDVGI